MHNGSAGLGDHLWRFSHQARSATIHQYMWDMALSKGHWSKHGRRGSQSAFVGRREGSSRVAVAVAVAVPHPMPPPYTTDPVGAGRPQRSEAADIAIRTGLTQRLAGSQPTFPYHGVLVDMLVERSDNCVDP